jgi:hypothetical protein
VKAHLTWCSSPGFESAPPQPMANSVGLLEWHRAMGLWGTLNTCEKKPKREWLVELIYPDAPTAAPPPPPCIIIATLYGWEKGWWEKGGGEWMVSGLHQVMRLRPIHAASARESLSSGLGSPTSLSHPPPHSRENGWLSLGRGGHPSLHRYWVRINAMFSHILQISFIFIYNALSFQALWKIF